MLAAALAAGGGSDGSAVHSVTGYAAPLLATAATDCGPGHLPPPLHSAHCISCCRACSSAGLHQPARLQRADRSAMPQKQAEWPIRRARHAVTPDTPGTPCPPGGFGVPLHGASRMCPDRLSGPWRCAPAGVRRTLRQGSPGRENAQKATKLGRFGRSSWSGLDHAAGAGSTGRPRVAYHLYVGVGTAPVGG